MAGRRRAPLVKRRRRFLLPRSSIGFSPFFRTLSRRLLRPVPGPLSRAAVASKGKDPSRVALPSERLASAHRRREPPPRESSSSSSDEASDLDEDEDEEGQDAMVEETVQVDFGFFDPKPEDFHGVKLLLRNYLGDWQWDLAGFVDLILEQTTVGTVVKSESPEGGEERDDVDGEGADDGEEGPYAVITVLNLGRYASHQCIKDLKKYLIEVCHDDSTKNTLRPMLEGEEAHSVGLLLCERFVNFPHQPVPHLYDALFDEVSWATEDEPTQEIQDCFRLKFYVVLTRIFMKKEDACMGKGNLRVSLRRKNKSSNNCKIEESVIYPKAEDEIFYKLCSLSFTFDLPCKEQFVPPELKNYKETGLVMIVESNEVPTFRKEVKSFLLET